VLAALPACLWRFQKNSSISLPGDGFSSSAEYFPPPTSFCRESREMALAMYRFQAWQFFDCNSRSSGAGRPYSVASRNHALSSARSFMVFGASSSMWPPRLSPHRTMLFIRTAWRRECNRPTARSYPALEHHTHVRFPPLPDIGSGGIYDGLYGIRDVSN
jgi:hypothetical protein